MTMIAGVSVNVPNQRMMMERIANASDKELLTSANEIAKYNVNDKKHRKIEKALYMSLPFAAGLAAIAKRPAASRIGNVANFAATTLGWIGTFAVVDGLFFAKHKLNQKSETIRNFDKEHPVVSTLATMGVALGTLVLGGKALPKLYKAGKNLAKTLLNPKITKKITKNMDKVAKYAEKGTESLAKFLDNSKVINKGAELYKKLPSAIKNLTKGVVAWSPLLIVLGSIDHSFNHALALNKETAKNFKNLKEVQAQAREYIAGEEA